MYFLDRKEAGEKLAKLLVRKYKKNNCVVYALPRGGVVTGLSIARALHAPLDVIIVKKIGHPFEEEYALAAVSETGNVVNDPKELVEIDTQWFAKQVAIKKEEILHRKQRYRNGKKRINPKGKIAVLVDDGIATGLTMQAAVIDIQTQHPKEIVIACPVIPKDTALLLQKSVDTIIALDIPNEFLGSVGAYYKEFPQVSDDEVIMILKTHKTGNLPDGTERSMVLV